jgi:peptidoglycan-N-acetylglucosamine deacetylase
MIQNDIAIKDKPLADTSGLAERIFTKNFTIKNFEYPKGIRLAVNFTIDYDAQLNRKLKNEPVMELSKGEFGGRVGIWRLLDLFDKYSIKLTIFTPGRICELYPDSLEEAVKRGHEIANHTWEHRIPANSKLELDHLEKTTSAIASLCGKDPIGTRSGHQLSLLKNMGYIYLSHNCADDIPYYVFDEEGRNSLLNLPFHFVLDDAMYFNFGFFSSENAGQRLADPSKVYDIWLAAFRQFYKVGAYMNICLHDFISGRSLRIAMLDRLINEMKQKPGVWFPSCEELARYCIGRFPPPSEFR